MQHPAPPPSPPDIESLWRELHDRFLAAILRKVGSSADAEDILQDVFVKIQANAHRLDQVENLTAWAHRVASNATIDFYRSRGRAVEHGVTYDEQLHHESSADHAHEQLDEAEHGARWELSHCMQPFVDGLKKPYRDALRLTELEQLTQKEAAARLGISVHAMKARVRRGRDQIKQLLLRCCEIDRDQRSAVIDFRRKDPGVCNCVGGHCDMNDGDGRDGPCAKQPSPTTVKRR